MMNFRRVKTSIQDILSGAENDRYRTIGFQRQSRGAIESLDLDRTVEIYYADSDFDKAAGRLNGPVQNDATYNIDLTVSKSAEGDMSAIINPDATQEERATALSLFVPGSQLADESIDELIDIIYQVLMDANNIDLGMPVGTISNRWISRIQKNNPLPQGEYVVITAQIQLICRIVEIIEGDSGIAGAKIYDTTVDIQGDDIEKTGVKVEE